MDGVTERRLAAIILGEVAKLQRQVEERGVSAYLHPQVRHRPNSRFLQATVTSVQQGITHARKKLPSSHTCTHVLRG